MASKLLAGVVEAVRASGGGTLEGYPSVVKADSKQAPAFLYKGTLSMFEAAGFKVVQRTNPGSPLVRKTVRPKRNTPAM